MASRPPNTHTFREPWLSDAVKALTPIFGGHELQIPTNLRCSFGLTSSGVKTARTGECWPADASDDGHFEIFVSPKVADPVEVLNILCHSLLHACLPVEARGHGREFKDAATRLGLQGKKRESKSEQEPKADELQKEFSTMRETIPGPFLKEALTKIAEALGPLPHAVLHIDQNNILDRPLPADRAKKQGTRMIKCECKGAGEDECMVVRVSGKWIKKLGPPVCPAHGVMTVDPSFNPEAPEDGTEDHDKAA
jgi:hypothetical protein